MRVLRVYVDECAENPRAEWDNLGHMVCWHQRYHLGDKHYFPSPDDFLYWVRREAREKNVIRLPLYLMDHGDGLCMRTTPFDASWDSDQVGWIYVTRSEIRREFPVKKRLTRRWINVVLENLEGEVAEYDAYLRGDVYGYNIFDVTPETVTFVDSLYGFYGADPRVNGMASEVPPEFRKALGTIGHLSPDQFLIVDGSESVVCDSLIEFKSYLQDHSCWRVIEKFKTGLRLLGAA